MPKSNKKKKIYKEYKECKKKCIKKCLTAHQKLLAEKTKIASKKYEAYKKKTPAGTKTWHSFISDEWRK